MRDPNIKIKETCYKMLKARLYEHELQKREEENQKELKLKQILAGGTNKILRITAISISKRFKK